MKAKTLFIFFLFTSSLLYAQVSFKPYDRFSAYNKYWQLDFTLGANFDMTRSSSNPDAILMSTRRDVAPMLNVRLNHFFSKQLGWYSNFQLNFYKEKDPQDGFVDEVLEGMMDKLLPGLTSFHPAVDVGLVYRIEKKRFRLHPSVGLGVNFHMSDEASSMEVDSSDSEKYAIRFERNGSKLFVNLGLAASYSVSDRSFLILRTGFHQPLQKSDIKMDIIKNGVETENRYYGTRTAGRSFSLSLGYGFVFGKR